MHLKTIVIGAAGFFGAKVADALERSGYTVVRLDRCAPTTGTAPVQIVDVTDRDAMHAAIRDAETVVNFAGLLGTSELNERAYDAAAVNILGMVNALDASLANGIQRFIYPSKPPIWNNIYTITKHAADRIAMLYRDKGLDVRGIIVRNAYGPAQSRTKVRKIVPDMVFRSVSGSPIQIFGNGEQPIDLIHVDDLAEIFTAAVSLEASRWPYSTPVEAGGSIRMTVNELATRVAQAAGVAPVFEYLPMREGESQDEALPPPSPPFVVDIAGLHLQMRAVDAGLAEIVSLYRTQGSGHA